MTNSRSSAMSFSRDSGFFFHENSQHRASTTAVLELYSASKKISKHWRESYSLQNIVQFFDKKMRLKYDRDSVFKIVFLRKKANP